MSSFLKCLTCGAEYSLNQPLWKCDCGGMLDIYIEYPKKGLWKTASLPGLWKFQPFIPLPDNARIMTLGEGQTPIIPLEYQNQEILIKQDQLFPTGSYKDRGATVMISAIKALGIQSVVEDSSGNAGCAVAAYCAKAGIRCSIYVPSSTSPAKLLQIHSYGATIVKVDGTREDTARAVWEAAKNEYYASHSWNPFFFQGTKTFAYEVWEQTNGRIPDAVILPVGNGTLLLGSYLGFRDLQQMGMIDKLPRLIGVQASLCSPLAHWGENTFLASDTLKNKTIAEGIAILNPVRGDQLIQVIKETNGQLLTVEEEEIIDALRLAVSRGFYIEPTSAVGLAGSMKYIQEHNYETVLTAFTGHGLKSPEKILNVLSR